MPVDILSILIFVGFIALVFMFFKYAVMAGVKGANKDAPRQYRRSPLDEEAARLNEVERMRNPPMAQRGFPLDEDFRKAYTGPGKYKVSGVDRQTKLDVTAYYDAASPGNAKAKAELDGIVVTEVEFDR